MKSPFSGRAQGFTPSLVALIVLLVSGVAFVVLVAWLVPWGAGDQVAGPAPAESVFTTAQIRRGEEYASTARILGWSSLGVATLVAALFGLTRLGSRLVRGSTRWWPIAAVGAVALFALITRLATLPFAWAARQRRLDEGLTQQATSGWIADLAREYVVQVLLTALVLTLLIWCARRWRVWWPAVAAGVGAGLVVVGSYLYPVLLEPVFNDFETMPDGDLRSSIMALADEEGVKVDDVLIADASRRTTTLNAYVSGFGSTKRVVVYDNLVSSVPEPQVLSVVAHELGHARDGDVVTGTALGAVGTAFGVSLLAVLVNATWLRRHSGSEGAGDVRVIPLVLALVAVGTLLASPVQATISRTIETRADETALEMTGDPEAFLAMQRTLCIRAVCDPTPPAFSQFWFGTHPTVLQRVAMAREFAGE
ncbi:M48 family metallopeptidase [Nocardioides sp. Bht2]|uniref:M48 family metallopeptidase n=1 Tax=Nocardioides sp. Bht2 TaxID=3392297 RepID=UPI0039B3CB25